MIYRSILHSVFKKTQKKAKQKETLLDFIKKGIAISLAHKDKITWSHLQIEHEYFKSKQKVYFVEHELSEMLLRSTFDIELSSLTRETHLFSMSVGENFYINDFLIPPVLVFCISKKAIGEWKGTLLYKIHELNNGNVAANSIFAMRCHIGQACYATTISSQAFLDKNLRDGFKHNSIKDGREQQHIDTIWRFYLRALAYMHTENALIVDGFPDYAKCKEVSKSTAHKKTIRLPLTFDKSITPHWRNAHFRTLRDARFKRNTDGTCRIIMVSPCIVGKIDPKTVTDKSGATAS